MAYEDKHGITTIKDSVLNSLEVSLDYDEDPKDKCPVLLHTPYKKDLVHYHIMLDKVEAKELHEWLGKYLKEFG